jgi:hypothetical protein
VKQPAADAQPRRLPAQGGDHRRAADAPAEARQHHHQHVLEAARRQPQVACAEGVGLVAHAERLQAAQARGRGREHVGDDVLAAEVALRRDDVAQPEVGVVAGQAVDVEPVAHGAATRVPWPSTHSPACTIPPSSCSPSTAACAPSPRRGCSAW